MTGWLADRSVRTKVLLVVAVLGLVAPAGSVVASRRLRQVRTGSSSDEAARRSGDLQQIV
ncbi:hypothetical protein Dvina_28930 [Dactylosporangium vinaceum]|uniref:Uncharacterized protein n=1 Tax=Dactylosporangium vinaceum TaxID=53362 RepID=A0ABV5MEI4_9ACTN|nr:hypothetical protein [Dactylosporangium vinaceum]UAB92387.1 hypothetical protein Dvina_28930 [Dactylosporangium vinaceum]